MKNKFGETLCKECPSHSGTLGANSSDGWDWVWLLGVGSFSPTRSDDWCESGLSRFRPIKISIVSAMLSWKCGWIWLGLEGGSCGEHKYADQVVNTPYSEYRDVWSLGAESSFPGSEW